VLANAVSDSAYVVEAADPALMFPKDLCGKVSERCGAHSANT
jgi:hypothetical protein